MIMILRKATIATGDKKVIILGHKNPHTIIRRMLNKIEIQTVDGGNDMSARYCQVLLTNEMKLEE